MTTPLDRNYTPWLVAVLGGVLIARLVSLWFNNSQLFFDEAQYWYWSTSLEFGYFSKPPLLGWLIAATTSICDSNSEFCVRLAAPVFHIATAVFIYLSAERLFDVRVAFWSAISWALLPAVSLSSTIISTDVPLLFFWSVALYAYVRFGENFRLEWALLMGLAIGLGINAKYAMVYFTGCAILHMVFEPQKLVPARKSGFWIGIALAALMIIPNAWWNFQNDFVTASHTGENIGWSGLDPNWIGLAEFFGSQFGVFGPVLFGMFIACIFSMIKDSISPQHRMLLVFSLPVLALILIQAVISKAYANWAATTYVAATILVCEVMVNRIPWHWMRTSLAIHVIAAVAIAIAVCFAGAGQIVLPGGQQPFERTQGADLIAAETRAMLDGYEYNGLITTDRKLSALMQYHLRDREESILAWQAGPVPRDHFEFDVPFHESLRDPVLVISRADNINAFKKGFRDATHLGSRVIRAGEIEKVYFFRLENHEKFQ